MASLAAESELKDKIKSQNLEIKKVMDEIKKKLPLNL